MGSQTAIKGMPLAGPYVASKVAVHSLTTTIYLENTRNVTCNAIVPGIIDTPANRQNMPAADPAGWVSLEAIANKIEELICSNQNGELVLI